MCLFFCRHFVISKTGFAVLFIPYHIIVTLDIFDSTVDIIKSFISLDHSWNAEKRLYKIFYLKDSIIYITNDPLLTIKIYIVDQSLFN